MAQKCRLACINIRNKMAAEEQEKKKIQREIAILSAAISNHRMETGGRKAAWPPPAKSYHDQSYPISSHGYHPYYEPVHSQTLYKLNKSSHQSSQTTTSVKNVVSKMKIVRNSGNEKQIPARTCFDIKKFSTDSVSRPMLDYSIPSSSHSVVNNVPSLHRNATNSSGKSQFKLDKRVDHRQNSGHQDPPSKSQNAGDKIISMILNRNKPTKRRRSSSTFLAQNLVKNSKKLLSHQSSFKVNRKGTHDRNAMDAAGFVNQIMGRSVKNVSRNKFKFVKEKKPKVLPSTSSLRIDRRSNTQRSSQVRRSTSLVMVNGRVVKNRIVSRTSIRVKRRMPDHDKRRMPADRMKIDRRMNTSLRIGQKNTESQRMAQSVLNRSRQIALKASKKKGSEKKFCTFYNRFGKCKRGEQCPFVHDRSKVAVCRRFIQGKCHLKECTFSHHLARDKMPVCGYYLRGLCTRDDCPYLHVNVNKEADVCREFLDGYCPRGLKCEKKHTLICQAWISTGACPDDKKCKLKHPKKRQKVAPPKKRFTKTEILEPGQMPSFIRLDSDTVPEERYHETETEKPSISGIKILPFFGDL